MGTLRQDKVSSTYLRRVGRSENTEENKSSKSLHAETCIASVIPEPSVVSLQHQVPSSTGTVFLVPGCGSRSHRPQLESRFPTVPITAPVPGPGR